MCFIDELPAEPGRLLLVVGGRVEQFGSRVRVRSGPPSRDRPPGDGEHVRSRDAVGSARPYGIGAPGCFLRPRPFDLVGLVEAGDEVLDEDGSLLGGELERLRFDLLDAHGGGVTVTATRTGDRLSWSQGRLDADTATPEAVTWAHAARAEVLLLPHPTVRPLPRPRTLRLLPVAKSGITKGASAAPGGEAIGRGKVGAALARGKAAEPGVGLQARVIHALSSFPHGGLAIINCKLLFETSTS